MKEMQTMVARVEDYLIARRQMGFDLGIAGSQLLAFALLRLCAQLISAFNTESWISLRDGPRVSHV